MIKEKLDQIRKPEKMTAGKDRAVILLVFAAGIALGIISKFLDNLALDSTVWWHRVIEFLNLGIFFSEIAVWLLAALLIAVCSASAIRAAVNVFVFFAGMCLAYHIYTVFFSGFNPLSYMMIWYGITLLSPLLAMLCWYAKGAGKIAVLLDAGILSVFFLACFSIGFFYIDLKGVLYLLVFACAVFILYTNPKQILQSILIGFVLSFLLSPIWPFK